LPFLPKKAIRSRSIFSGLAASLMRARAWFLVFNNCWRTKKSQNAKLKAQSHNLKLKTKKI